MLASLIAPLPMLPSSPPVPHLQEELYARAVNWTGRDGDSGAGDFDRRSEGQVRMWWA